MKLFIKTGEEFKIAKDNNLEIKTLYKEKTYYFYIEIESLNEVENNKYLLDFQDYTPLTNILLLEESVNNHST